LDSLPVGAAVFPYIYQNGKFLDGVSVVTGSYKTYNNKMDGTVTLRSDYIEIIPSEGNDQYSDEKSTGHYKMKLKLSRTLDLTGYDGIQVEWEGVKSGLENFSVTFTFYDATGKTLAGNDEGHWDANNLLVWTGNGDVRCGINKYRAKVRVNKVRSF